MERKKVRTDRSCEQRSTFTVEHRQPPLLEDLLSYKNLPIGEKENLYNVLCWLCIGLTQCRQQSTCQATCCKGVNIVERASKTFGETVDEESLSDQKNITVAVASLIHPEIASKLKAER